MFSNYHSFHSFLFGFIDQKCWPRFHFGVFPSLIWAKYMIENIFFGQVLYVLFCRLKSLPKFLLITKLIQHNHPQLSYSLTYHRGSSGSKMKLVIEEQHCIEVQTTRRKIFSRSQFSRRLFVAGLVSSPA